MSELRRMLSVLWQQHRRSMLAVGVLALLMLVTEGLGLFLLVPVLRTVGVRSDGDVRTGAEAMLDRLLAVLHVPPTLGALLALVVVLVSVRAAVQWSYAVAQARLETAVVGQLRTRLFAAVVSMPWARFTGERPAAILHALGPQVDDVHSALILVLQGMSVLATILAGSVVALALSPALFAVVGVSGVLIVALARLLRAPGRADGEQLLGVSEGLFARLGEFLGGLKMVHAHQADAHAVQTVAGEVEQWQRLTRRVATRRGGVTFAMAVASAVLLAVLVLAATSWVRVPPATLLVLLALYARLVPRVADLQVTASHLQQALASYVSVQGLLARCEAAAHAAVPDAEAHGVVAGLMRSAPAIALRGVAFRYPGAVADAVQPVTLEMAAGQVTAIVGESGTGKTTIADIVLGLLTPTAGEVLVDGRPLREWPRGAWRGLIGYLAQEPMLLHGTIRENLRLARPEATDAQLRAALAAAACDFVAALPQGLDAPIGDRGIQMSGGERQRLALARALLREPRLLVLDEATSALDAETEQRVLATVRALRGECTVLLITHREAPLAVADAVVRLSSVGG